MIQTGAKLLCALVFIGLTATDHGGESWTQRHKQILYYTETGALPDAERALLKLREASPSRFAENNYDYLLGRLRR